MPNPFEERFRLLFEACPVAVWLEDFREVAGWFDVLRAAGTTDQRAYFRDHPGAAALALAKVRIIDVNAAAAEQNGAASREELLSRLPELFTRESLDVLAEELACLFEGRRVIGLEIPTRRLDGRMAFLHMRVHVPGPLDAPDWGQVIVTGTDITAHREAEEHLRETARLSDEANRAKSAFLANMSHEIRTPINGVLGMTTLLLGTDLTAEQREYALAANQSCRSLLRIINDLLDLSKIEAGRMEIVDEEYCLRSLADMVLDVVAPDAGSKELELAAVISRDVPLRLLGDPARIRQILVNLVGNAVKFTARGRVVLRAACEGPGLRITVEDTGIGISGETLGRLFQPFTQADNSTTRRFGGSGLGLAIVRELVTLLGGSIHAESEEGHGSVFSVLLPLRTVSPTGPIPSRGFALVDGLRPSETESAKEYLATLGFPVSRDKKEKPDLMIFGENQSCLPTSGRVLLAGSPEFLARAYASGAGALLRPIRWGALVQAVSESGRRGHPADLKLESSLRILIVEDNKTNQIVLHRMLLKLGTDAAVTDSGNAALAAVADRDFDLVLLDIQMPDMDGYEVARRIRAGQCRMQPALAAVSANAFEEDRRKAAAAGIDHYLTKPVSVEELRSLLLRVRGKPGEAEATKG